MSSLIKEEKLLDDGDISLLISPSISERQKIFVLCDIPNGCGPISTWNSMQNIEVWVCGQKEGDFQKKGRDLSEAEGETCSVECNSHDIPVFPNRVDFAVSSSVKREKIEDENEELLEMPVVNPKPPSAWQGTSILNLKEPANAIKQEVMDEGTMLQPNLVWEEQRCSCLKRVSPICDFRACKVPRLGEIQDEHFGQCETMSNIHNVVVVNDVNQTREQPGDNAFNNKIQQGGVFRENGHVLEDPFVSHKGACDLSKIKREEAFFEDNNDEQGKTMEEPFSINDQNKKKRSTGISLSNTGLIEDRIAGVKNEDMVVVQGPMSMPKLPRREEKEAVKTSQSMARGKTKEGMKLGCAMRNIPNCSPNKSNARRKVRDTVRLFHGVLRKLVQANENKSKGRVDASIQINAALKIFKDHGKYINAKKMMGSVPGVEVGDLFNYRVELDIIGLHKPLQSGIDFVKLDNKLIAISVVASGRYDNDLDNSDVLIYVGQGGNVAGGCKQLEDQKLQGGNLALKNSIDEKNLVRVIRGFKERKQSQGKRVTIPTYIYDGLYTVERYWQEHGPHGMLVYKFELKRGPHQPELTWNKVKKSKKSKKQERCVDDISKGKEKTPIFAVNTIDDEKPAPFTYITSVMYPDWCRPLPPRGCDCKNGCSDSKHCACALKNGGEIPYNYSGAIVEEKPLVYECGPSCKCPPSCHNRVSQHGIKLPLEIFKTESMGWGLRSLSSIPSGSFVCEYIGELLDDKEAEQRIDNDEYLFDIGRNYNDPTVRDGLSVLMPNMSSSCSDVVQNVGFTLDAAKFGNVGRFINHSCSPNLFAQNVLYDHDDKRVPHIMMFAAENIPPMQELTYHYNYTIDQVFDSEGNIKKKSCHCGSSECTGRMY